MTPERTADHLKSCEFSRKLKEQGFTVRTHYQYFGWVAVDDNTYDGPGSALGIGQTEYEAIEDLMEQIKDKEERVGISNHEQTQDQKLDSPTRGLTKYLRRRG